MEHRFDVLGKVQGVFFRRSFVYWVEKQNLKGGATNNHDDCNRVHCTIFCDQNEILKLKERLAGSSINNVGAHVDAIDETDHAIELEKHQAKTKTDGSGLPFGIRLLI